MLVLLTGITASGWTFGAPLVALAALANAIPQGWATRELLAGQGRRTALLVGLAMVLAATALYVATEIALSPPVSSSSAIASL